MIARTSCIWFQSTRRHASLLTMAVGAALLLGIGSGHSQGTIYTDRSTFNAALQSSTNFNFENLPPYDGFGPGASAITIRLNPSPASPPILTITSQDGRLFVAGPGLSPRPSDGQYIWNFDSSYPIGIGFPGGRNAFGADFSGGYGSNPLFDATLSFTLLDGQTYTHNFTGQKDAWTFQGFVFSQSITSVIYDDGGQGPELIGTHEEMIDNVTYGVAVPEPQILTLVLGMGLLALQSKLRRP